MSDTLAGLNRRIGAFVHDRNTLEELSHILDEAKEDCDTCDTLIELALGANDDDSEDDTDGLDIVMEDEEVLDGEEIDFIEDGSSNENGDEFDDELDDLDDLDDDDSLGEAAFLLPGEVVVL